MESGITALNLNSYLNSATTLHEKCPCLEFSWFVFSRIRTEYGGIRSISPYSVRMQENTDHKNSEYGHFSRSEIC